MKKVNKFYQAEKLFLAMRVVFFISIGLLLFLPEVVFLSGFALVFSLFCFLQALFLFLNSVVIFLLRKEHWWFYIPEAIFNLILGVALFIWPGLDSVGLNYFVAIWFITNGVLKVFHILVLKKATKREIMGVLDALSSVLIGGIIFERVEDISSSLTYIFSLYCTFHALMLFSHYLNNSKVQQEI